MGIPVVDGSSGAGVVGEAIGIATIGTGGISGICNTTTLGTISAGPLAGAGVFAERAVTLVGSVGCTRLFAAF